MASKTDIQVTKDLQDTVRSHPNIQEVYFDSEGNHYFQKHKIILHEDDGEGVSKGSKEVEALPGSKMGILKVKQGNSKQLRDQRVNVECNEIAVTMTRSEVLKAKAVERKMSDKEQLEILKKASEIANSAGFERLMGMVNNKAEA